MLDDHLDVPKEECGIVGIYAPGGQASREAFFGLFALQHRGQESAGIAVGDGVRVKMFKDLGLVANVFHKETLEDMPGEFAIGHTRYSTTGANVQRNAQPIEMFCQSLVGKIAVAHNGNLTNAAELREEMQKIGVHFETSSDTEVLAHILVNAMDKGVESAVAEVMQRVKGAYSVTVVTPNSIIAFRDPLGIRPLVYGRLGEGYLIASESCAFGPLGAEVIDEVEPGQMVVITSSGLTLKKLTDNKREAMCLFEYIYFARPDSVMNGHLLYSVRERMGAELAIEHPVEADIVVPVPDSGIPAALGYSKQSGIPYREGMTKSRYIHRTFIQPDQRMRDLGVRMKLTPLREHLEGMRVVLVDDSIVRGTTTNQIVRMLFDAGAKEVHVRITAPPIKFPCFYGIDMASRKELIAARLSWDELVAHVGATSLGYLSTSGAIKATRQSDSKLCLACFTGDYPLPVPEGTSKNSFENSGTFGEMGTYQDNDQPTLIDALS